MRLYIAQYVCCGAQYIYRIEFDAFLLTVYILYYGFIRTYDQNYTILTQSTAFTVDISNMWNIKVNVARARTWLQMIGADRA